MGAMGAIRIVSVGARSPVGLNALQTAMCARARKLEPRGVEWFDWRGERAGLCLAAGCPEGLYGFDRCLALALPALREACHAIELNAPVPLVMALPEAGRGDNDPRFTEIAGLLAQRSGIPIDLARSAVIRGGHAGGAAALQRAAAWLLSADVSGVSTPANAGVAPRVVLAGGVDSYYHPRVVEWLSEERRLHSLETEDGFLPGEGAAFALLALEDTAAALFGPPSPHAPVLALVDVRCGREESIVRGDPNAAAALTEILREIADGWGDRPPGWVLNDCNGERHRVKEWEKLAARGVIPQAAEVHALPDDMGDLGAASGLMMLAIAWMGVRLGYAPANRALCVLASDGPDRGGFLIEAMP